MTTPAYILDGTTGGVKSDSTRANPGPIDNTKNGAVNLGSNSAAGVGGARAHYALCAGDQCDVTGDYGFATGYASQATAACAFASGNQCTASGANAFASGNQSVASGDNSFACGTSSTADGNNAFAAGGCRGEGTNSFAVGSGSHAQGIYSACFNLNCVAGAHSSSAFGEQTEAHGIHSMSQGEDTRAYGESSFCANNFNRTDGRASACFGTNCWTFGTVDANGVHDGSHSPSSLAHGWAAKTSRAAQYSHACGGFSPTDENGHGPNAESQESTAWAGEAQYGRLVHRAKLTGAVAGETANMVYGYAAEAGLRLEDDHAYAVTLHVLFSGVDGGTRYVIKRVYEFVCRQSGGTVSIHGTVNLVRSTGDTASAPWGVNIYVASGQIWMDAFTTLGHLGSTASVVSKTEWEELKETA